MLKRLAAFLAVALLAIIGSAEPAHALIGNDAWDRSTIVIQTMKAGNANETAWLHDRISNARAAASSTLSIVEGSCQPNMPCIQVWWDFYGNTTWAGLTTFAPEGCLALNRWCRYDATNGYHTTVQFNRSFLDGYTQTDVLSATCHELGHAIWEEQHEAGATCMQAASYAYITYSTDEIVNEMRPKYAGVAR